MTEDAKLCAQQINHGQSEIWLEAEGKEPTQRRRLATNEVVNVTRDHCASEVFKTFYTDYHTATGHVATLAVPSLDEIAAELPIGKESNCAHSGSIEKGWSHKAAAAGR